MQIEIQIDDKCKEPKVVILTNKITDEINDIVKKLSEETPDMICGFKDDKLEILEQKDIFKIYSSNGKIFGTTENGEYILKLRLYELEERLDKKTFVRISNGEIINLKKVKSFDLSFSGTICVSLYDDTTTFVSRRYVSKIKQVLGI